MDDDTSQGFAILADFKKLYKDGASPAVLESCEGLQALAPVKHSVALGARKATATLRLLEMAATDDAPIHVRAGAAITGVKPRSLGSGKRNDPGPGERKLAAGQIDGDIGGRAVQEKYKKVYFPAYASALLELADSLQIDSQLMSTYLENCGLKPSADTLVVVPEPNKLPSASPFRESYVARPELETKFKHLLADQTTRVVVVVGQSGMGKTWLVEELTRDSQTGDLAPRLDVSNLEQLAANQAGVFSMLGMNMTSDMSIVAQIASLVCGEKAPPIVILDNLESADGLTALLPRHTRSKIVAICLSASESPLYSMLTVECMERSESLAFIKGRLADLPDDDAEYLARSFGDYPLVIGHVCTVFLDQQSPMRVLCDSLQRDARQLAEAIKTEDGAILLATLRRTLKIVAARDRHALNLLSLISFISHASSRSYLAIVFQGFVSKGSILNLRFAMAVGVLKELALVQFDASSNGLAIIHPFTQAVLRRELELKAEWIFALTTLHMMQLHPSGKYNEDLIKELREYGIDTSDERERENFIYKNSKGMLVYEIYVQWLHCLYYWAHIYHPEWASYSEEKRYKIFDSLLQRYGFRLKAVNPADENFESSTMKEIVQMMTRLSKNLRS